MTVKPQISARITPVVVENGFAFISGQLPREDGQLQCIGKVGTDVQMDKAQAAAAICARNCVNVLLSKVRKQDVLRIVKLTGFVASASDFNTQASVIDAASDVILEEFGPEIGAHARSAVGVAELPHNASVEVEMIVAIKR